MRRLGGLGALVSVAAAGLLACTGQPRSIFGVDGGRDHGSVGGAAPQPLIGGWRAVIVIDAGSDIQEWTTTWRFAAGGQCHLTKTARSLAEGITRTTDRDCTFVDRATAVEVTYVDTGTTTSMPYSVPSNSTTHLVIEGIDYERIS
jgi:hypothetical protein